MPVGKRFRLYAEVNGRRIRSTHTHEFDEAVELIHAAVLFATIKVENSPVFEEVRPNAQKTTN